MTFFDVLTMIGGLALFLYGMNLLGEALANASGGKLEKILEKLTNNPIKAVLLGAGVTAVIQSSSATTVMVVGFVNSGIMKLEQAVGIIMGANIGTTVTSWILGLTGIESESFWIQLLKPSSFSPVLAIIGVAVIMFSKKEKWKNFAGILVGFAILMFGMETMSNAVKPLADIPEFTGILTKFSNPLYGVIAGFILTAIIQSSSASVGILQALCMTGAIGYSAALPIIMGQNIGTCITALLSSIGATKNAKRAALIHLYFNLIGTILFMGVFYAIHAFAPFSFMGEVATPFGIASLHSVFNVVSTIALLPFSKLLVKLSVMTLHDEDKLVEITEEDRVLGLLDARFLETPSFAIEQCRTVAIAMANMAEESINLSLELLDQYDKVKAKRVIALEADTDRFEDELGSYLVKLSGKSLLERDNRTLSVMLHSISDFERISDHARNLKEAAQEMHKKEIYFSEKAQKELAVLKKAIYDILKITILSFTEEDYNLAKKVEPLEEVINGLNYDIKKRHIKRLRKGTCTIELGFILTDIATNLERVSDHCSNIAISLVQTGEEEWDPHAYIDNLKQESNIDFYGKVEAYKERYQLP